MQINAVKMTIKLIEKQNDNKKYVKMIIKFVEMMNNVS